jgi:hypothetical protein
LYVKKSGKCDIELVGEKSVRRKSANYFCPVHSFQRLGTHVLLETFIGAVEKLSAVHQKGITVTRVLENRTRVYTETISVYNVWLFDSATKLQVCGKYKPKVLFHEFLFASVLTNYTVEFYHERFSDSQKARIKWRIKYWKRDNAANLKEQYNNKTCLLSIFLILTPWKPYGI